MQHLYHSSVDGYLDCFHVLADINSAAMDIGIHVFLFELRLFVFFGYTPRNGLVGSIYLLEFYF